MAAILGYWACRDLGQSIRNLLVYKGVEFEDKQYVEGPAPDFRSKEWLKDKVKLGIGFPSLPYFINCDFKTPQTIATLRYLGRKHYLVARYGWLWCPLRECSVSLGKPDFGSSAGSAFRVQGSGFDPRLRTAALSRVP